MMTISGTAMGVMRPVSTWSIVADARSTQTDEAAELGHPRACIVPRRVEQEVVGLVAAEHVVDEVGRKADLPARLLLARMVALDQPADHRDLAEGAS